MIAKGGKQVILLYCATFLGSILNFVASKVNTDVLTTEDYGNLRYVLNIIQLISWLVLFGWFMSGSRLLALSDDPKKSSRIRGVMVVCLVISSILLMSATLLAAFIHWGTPELRTLFFCSVPVCFYPLLTNYMNTTAQGDNHIVRLSLARALPVLIYLPCALYIFGHYGADSKTVLWLHWGICSAVIILIIISTRPSFRDLKPVFEAVRKENRDYGIKLYWGSVVMVATNYISGVTLGIFNDDNSVVGFYSLALSFAQPLSYLPGIVGTTYFKRFVNEKKIPAKVLIVTVILSVLSCLGFIIIIKPLINIYNPSYGVVARYASVLAIGFCIHGLGDMINRYLGSHGMGDSIRNSSFACGTVKIAGSILLVWLWDVKGALLTMIFSSVIYTLYLCFEYKSYIKGK